MELNGRDGRNEDKQKTWGKENGGSDKGGSGGDGRKGMELRENLGMK